MTADEFFNITEAHVRDYNNTLPPHERAKYELPYPHLCLVKADSGYAASDDHGRVALGDTPGDAIQALLDYVLHLPTKVRRGHGLLYDYRSQG